MTEIITAEEAVQRFLNEYHAWTLAGAPVDHEAFTRSGGLCNNLYWWTHARQLNIVGYPSAVMQELWTGEGLHNSLPFDVSVDAHYDDCALGVSHLNKVRTDFVARHAK